MDVWDEFTVHDLNNNNNDTTNDFELIELKSLITIVDLVAKIQITKRIRNKCPHALEVKYSFPRESSTQSFAIIDFQIRTQDGRVFKGIVQEKRQAFKTYDNAISKGHGAYLLEHDTQKNRFAVNLGNWLPNTEIDVMMTVVTQLSFISSSETLFVSAPIGISPSLLSPSTPCAVHIKAHITGASKIIQLHSSSHTDAISTVLGTQASLEYQSRNIHETKTTFLKFDIVLKIQETHVTRSWLEYDAANNSCAALICFYPPQTSSGKNQPIELVFLVDRSGSMNGEAIEAVKNTLMVAIQSLPPNTFFNIVSFGSSFDSLFDTSMEVSSDSIQIALEEIKRMKADMGGTELLNPLKSILETNNGNLDIAFLSRQIFVLTDGDVANPNAIITDTQEASKLWRVFTFGILSRSSDKIVRALANAGRGVAEFIRDPDDIKPIVLKQLHRATQPNVTDIAVDWGGIEVSQTPFRIPPFFPGEQVLIYGFLRNYDPSTQQGSFTLQSTSLDGVVDIHTCKLDNPHIVTKKEECWIHSLAARALISDVENLQSPFHDEQGLVVDRKSMEDYVVDIGVKYRIASKWTSFVIVEERQEAMETTTTFLNLSENSPSFSMMTPSVATVKRVQASYYIKLALHSTNVSVQLRIQLSNRSQFAWDEVSQEIVRQLKPALGQNEATIFVEFSSHRIQLTGNVESIPPSELEQLESLHFVVEGEEHVMTKIQQYYFPPKVQNKPEEPEIPSTPKTSRVLEKVIFPAVQECKNRVQDTSVMDNLMSAFTQLEVAKPGMAHEFVAEIIRTLKQLS